MTSTANREFAPKPRKRPARYKETPEFVAGIRRLLRAYRIRVGDRGDIDQLTEMAEMRREVDEMIHDTVNSLHDRGYSTAEIAARMGISRQAVWQQYIRKSLTSYQGDWSVAA